MDAAVWLVISIAGYSLAGVLFAAAIVIFFKMNIPAIIGDLTGKTAAKQIQEIREQNSRTGSKHYRPSAFNMERGYLTEQMSSRIGRSGRIGKTGQALAHQSKRLDLRGTVLQVEPEQLELKKTGNPVVNRHDLNQEVLKGPEPKSGLAESAKLPTVNPGAGSSSEKREPQLQPVDRATSVLSEATEVLQEGGATTVLSEETEVLPEDRATSVLSEATEVLAEEEGTGTDLLFGSTEVLTAGDETAVLSEAATEVLSGGGTEILQSGTEVLTEENEPKVFYATEELVNDEESALKETAFKIVKDIKVIHTTEAI